MKEKCSGEFGCIYSKAMGQPYPRLCVNCGQPEESAIDHLAMNILTTPISTSTQLKLFFQWLELRDHSLRIMKNNPNSHTNLVVEEIKQINERIKQILHL